MPTTKTAAKTTHAKASTTPAKAKTSHPISHAEGSGNPAAPKLPAPYMLNNTERMLFEQVNRRYSEQLSEIAANIRLDRKLSADFDWRPSETGESLRAHVRERAMTAGG